MRQSTVLTCLAVCLLAGCWADPDNNSPDVGPNSPHVDTIPNPHVTTVDPYGETVKKVELVEQNWDSGERQSLLLHGAGIPAHPL